MNRVLVPRTPFGPVGIAWALLAMEGVRFDAAGRVAGGSFHYGSGRVGGPGGLAAGGCC